MGTTEVTIIDYGVGNLLSVQRGFEHVGASVNITADSEQILAAQRIVLPGVGAFSNAMEALNQLNLVQTIQEVARQKIPLLGICLGMQLLLDESEEFGQTQGLGLISGKATAIPKFSVDGMPHKVPHIGWCSLRTPTHLKRWDNSLLQDIDIGEAVYFVHSYMASLDNPADCLANCSYNGNLIPAAIARNHIMGCQFHPEKSGEVGLKILRRFLSL